jgi:hypothetical protein
LPDIGGRKLSNGDAVIGGALVVGLITTFLPWYSASFNCGGIPGCGGLNTSVSVGALSYWTGWFFFLAVLVGLAFYILRTFVPTVALPAMPQPDAVLYMILGAFMAVMAILWLLLGSGTASVSGPGYSAGASFGLFIGIIAAIGVLAGGYLKRSDPQVVSTMPMSSGTMYGGPPSSPPPPPV